MAVDHAGNLSEPAMITACTSSIGDIAAPTAPANVTGIAIPGGIAQIWWGAAADNVGVTGYKILRAADGDGMKVIGIFGADKFSYRDQGLASETTYSYTVVAFNAAGNESVPSSPVSVTTPTLEEPARLWF